MAFGHKDGRRPGRRAFRPTLDGRLETRELLSSMSIRSQTAAGGQAVVITITNGQQFFVSVTQGTIQATPASGGRVNLVAKGTTSNTLLEINQIIPMHGINTAHTFNASLGSGTGILNINSIKIVSGFINSIEGYHDAVLSGPITVAGTAPVNRIALTAIKAGGSISVGGDLDTLDILNTADFTKPPGLSVGQDLNWFEVGGDVTFEDGANMTVGRDLGLTPQVAKGSGNPGQGMNINGNLTIVAPSNVTIGRSIPFGVVINGNLSGGTRISIGGSALTSLPFNFLVLGTATA